MNKVRRCTTPGCDGDMVPVSVNAKRLGGSLSVACCCSGCAQKGAVFETSPERVDELGNSSVIGICVQVAFIIAGNTYAGYYKLLKNAFGIEAVDGHTFMDTIRSMYPVVKSFLDDIAKEEMKAKDKNELGSWKRAVTVGDGTWHTRGWHSKNATFTIRNYLKGALLYYHHLCQKGKDYVIEEELYKGTSKSAEGYAARLTFQRAKYEGMDVAIHWQDADSSSAKVVNELFPKAEVMLCGGHAGRAHKKVRRIEALPKHARDVHEWEGGRCDFHPLRVCSCGECDSKEQIECVGEPYKTSSRLDCESHAMLYEIECSERAAQASKLVHPILKRGHTNAVESSHNVLIRFRSKDIPLQRLHYHVSTNLGLLQANLTYMQGKFGTSYHWIPELYHRMKLPVF